LRSPAPEKVPTWSSALIGTLVHEAIQWCALKEDHARPDASDRSVTAVVPNHLAPMHALMVRQRVHQDVLTWLERYDRRPTWKPLGAEVHVGDVRVDLLWQDASGRIAADEMKTGWITTPARNQLAAIDAAGRGLYGRLWEGVRLIDLAESAPEDVA
jgi:hypothetical protein